MYFTNVQESSNSFSGTIVNQLNNSVDIETASIGDDYVNKEMLYFEKTEQHLKLFDNLLLNKYYKQIKESCTILTLDKAMNFKYKYRPEALSTDQYGTPALWYVLLYVNGCEDSSEFKDFDYVLIPSLTTIQKCLTNEEFISKKDVL